MKKKIDADRADADNPEWTAEMFARAKPAAEVYPDLVECSEKRKRGQRGAQKAPVKKPIKLRVDHDVLARYRASGPGWQSRMNDALRRGSKSL
jgi:uncharacterized protein (DUF4415 family)